MYLSLFIIFFVGILGGILFEKIKIPKIIFYLILGILIGCSVFNIIDPMLENISDYLRQIALIIILTRSGLTLNFKELKKNGRIAILMCFLPATIEIIGVVIFGPILLNISYLESFLLGAVLGAVSPAIVVPRMLSMIEKKEGGDIPKIIMAGSSCDDIYVLVLFYMALNALQNNKMNLINILQIPISIGLGALIGIIGAIILLFIFKYLKIKSEIKIILMLGISLLMVYLENILRGKIAISALLGIICCMIFINNKINDIDDVKASYNHLWNGFEIILFVLVGSRVRLDLIISLEGIKILLLIIIGLIFRSIGVLICTIGSNYKKSERLFFIISYIPKATVQASIGGIALSLGLGCGQIILAASVIAIVFTASIGAFLMDYLRKKLFLNECI